MQISFIFKFFSRFLRSNPYQLFCYYFLLQGKLQHLFWANSTTIVDYKLFRDLVSFDTTYNTNKYKLVFDMFCEFNHHLNSILFGVGLLSNENKESFVWIFNEFLKCMRIAFATIIIDQDRAMEVALPLIFPNKFQWFCKCHITHIFADNIGNVYRDKVAMEEFQHFLNNEESTDIFDVTWQH